MQYPKRLIEVDLPIKRISEHARREKSIRHGHISTLHIWWARRPLAACRAVICAALWPDTAPGKDDAPCPHAFIKVAKREMLAWTTHERQELLSEESRPRFEAARRNSKNFDDPIELRQALLDFIADFANWANSTVPEYLETSRTLTQAAHEALGGVPGTKPLVVDPFAGGGSIPLEALRVGADTFASDLNPIPVLLNKVTLEYIPKYGLRLADEVRKWGEWIKREIEKDLSEFYPKDKDGATPIAYLWARTIKCEGPGCGVEVPLIRSLWLAKKSNRSVAMQIVPRPRAKRVDFQIIVKEQGGWVDQDNPKNKIPDPRFEGTMARGSATCPCCGYTTPVASVRIQLKQRKGGATDARLFAIVTITEDKQGRFYRLPTENDLEAARKASKALDKRIREHKGKLSLVPDEILPVMSGVFNAPIYGHNTWGSLFTPRQLLALTSIVESLHKVGDQLKTGDDIGLATAVQTCLAMALDKQADSNSSLCGWRSTSEDIGHTFGRQAIPMVWDFVEANVLSGATRDWLNAVEGGLKAIGSLDKNIQSGHTQQASATAHPLPDGAAQCFFSDPPYYNAVPYADLSDFFYVWMRRTIGNIYPELFQDTLAPKEKEICEMSGWDSVRYANKDKKFFEREMGKAMSEARRFLSPSGIGIVVFAHKSTGGWEAQLQAMVEAGWIVTGSWPIDTELGNRLRAMNSAVLASSVHLVCRPRENTDGPLQTGSVGDWRDVLAELPKRIHAWMPRLAEEGVVGADAIFACLGPALEIFSRYTRVEKPGGEKVTLKEYLEHVWAAVAKEALSLIFSGADATGFEEDARLTAMWLWTLSTNVEGGESSDEGDDAEDVDSAGKGKKSGGYVLEYDAARKIAQGLGAHLEDLIHTIEVMGDKARLLPVAERTRYLFGKDEADAPRKRKKRDDQMLFKGIEREVEEAAEEGGWGEKTAPKAGNTVLDRVHQAMILFAAGRGEAMKRFLVEEGIGNDNRFWKLAQAFSALYPPKSDEKRWVDGVLARKKGLGF